VGFFVNTSGVPLQEGLAHSITGKNPDHYLFRVDIQNTRTGQRANFPDSEYRKLVLSWQGRKRGKA